MTTPIVDDATIEQLRFAFRGDLIRPGDPDYENARLVFNGMIDRRPALVARCTGNADVVAMVNFARERGLPLAVRGGAHSVAGYSTCDDGVVIDLSRMRGVRVDPAAATVRAQGGCTWGDVDRETQVFGLATPGGVVSTTGIAGLTLGGGLGWLRRKFGLSCDNLISVDLVTAAGERLRASEAEHPELFWGLRGGGGNFGVATSFEFRAHPIGPDVFLAMVFHPGTEAPAALRFYREYTRQIPDAMATAAALLTAPAGATPPVSCRGYRRQGGRRHPASCRCRASTEQWRRLGARRRPCRVRAR